MLILSAEGRVEIRRRDDWRECDRVSWSWSGTMPGAAHRLTVREEAHATRPKVTCRAREPGSVGPHRTHLSLIFLLYIISATVSGHVTLPHLSTFGFMPYFLSSSGILSLCMCVTDNTSSSH